MGLANNDNINKNQQLTFEQTEKLYKFLQGEIPNEITLLESPNLSSEMAFGIIYYLQEIVGIIPDTYERCDVCGCLYDSESEGIGTEEGSFCNYHIPTDKINHQSAKS